MKPIIYQTDEDDFRCMDLDGEGAVIYGTTMESPQHLMMSSSASRAAEGRVKPGGGSVCVWCSCL